MKPGERPRMALLLLFTGILPPTAPTLAQELDTAALPAVRQAPWVLSLSLDESWDSNLRLRSSTTPASSQASEHFLTRASGDLSYTHFARWGSAGLSGGGGAFLRSLEGVDRLSYRGSASADVQVSRRGTVRATASSSRSEARTQDVLIEAGNLLPFVNGRTDNAVLGFDAQLGARTSLTGEGRFLNIDFDSDVLRDGSEWVGSGTLSRIFWRVDNLSLNVRYTRSTANGQNGSTRSALLGWSRPLGRRWTVSTQAGITDFDPLDSPDRVLTFSGGLGLALRLRRTGFTAQYSRFVAQAFGYARDRVVDRGAVRLTRSIGRKVSVNGNVMYARSRSVSDDSFRYRTLDANGAVSWLIVRSLGVTGSYGLQQVTFPPAPPTTSHRVTMAIVYKHGWR